MDLKPSPNSQPKMTAPKKREFPREIFFLMAASTRTKTISTRTIAGISADMFTVRRFLYILVMGAPKSLSKSMVEFNDGCFAEARGKISECSSYLRRVPSCDRRFAQQLSADFPPHLQNNESPPNLRTSSATLRALTGTSDCAAGQIAAEPR